MFCQQWSYFRYNKEVVEVSNQKYKRPMETSAAPVCHLDLMWIRSDLFSSLVIISSDNFLIKEWSLLWTSNITKNSVKYGVHVIDLHSYYTTAVLSFLAPWYCGILRRLRDCDHTYNAEERKSNSVQRHRFHFPGSCLNRCNSSCFFAGAICIG